MYKKLISCCAVLFVLVACNDEITLPPDGRGSMNVSVLYSAEGGIEVPLDSAEVILISEYGNFTYLTDNEGKANINDLPAASYNVAIKKIHPLDKSVILSASEKEIELNSSETLNKNYLAIPVSGNGIVINEIYSAGPDNNIFFFYDQFIELYNSSDEIKYLDGMYIYRISGNRSEEGIIRKGPGADEDDDGDIDGVTYTFKFPGKSGEKNIPLAPKSYVVLAQDAVNHKSILQTAIDLSNADWEFFNQYSAIDIDNKNVPNLMNMRPDKTVDFMINLVSDVIALSDGRDTLWSDGIDIDTIVDAVQYKSKSTYRKTLDDRVDRGLVISPALYSGKSMRRRIPGMDSNDGSLDWEIAEKPTPGYDR